MIPLLPLLDVVFVGLVGSDPGHVDRQILKAEPRLVTQHVAPALLDVLAKHDDGAADVVVGLGVDGVVTGELVTAGKHRSLRLVIYRRNGTMASLSETALVGKTLGKDDVDVLTDNLGDEIGSLLAHASKPERKPAASSSSPGKMDDSDPFASSFDGSKPAAPKRQPPVMKPAVKQTPAHAEPAAPVAAAAPPAAATQVADADADTTTGDSDAVSADEIAALNTGSVDADLSSSASAAPAGDGAPELHLRAGAGLGLTGRGFTPGPSSLVGYNSAAVGAVHLDAAVQPFARATIAVGIDRSLGMETTLGGSSSATTIGRWEATATYGVSIGKLELAPELGLGRRTFTIDAAATGRTPDSDYKYVIAGATAAYPITGRVTVRGAIALEPVIGGTDPTAMQLGSATRWAFDAGASVDVRAGEHLVVRALADYQQFTWSWGMAGDRGAGGATDSYPTGTLALAATY
jgi:hypothetical protein|nr:hypothetical protein [Kofleriaceae bacterium]